jgi:hypothetical protein
MTTVTRSDATVSPVSGVAEQGPMSGLLKTELAPTSRDEIAALLENIADSLRRLVHLIEGMRCG